MTLICVPAGATGVAKQETSVKGRILMRLGSIVGPSAHKRRASLLVMHSQQKTVQQEWTIVCEELFDGMWYRMQITSIRSSLVPLGASDVLLGSSVLSKYVMYSKATSLCFSKSCSTKNCTFDRPPSWCYPGTQDVTPLACSKASLVDAFVYSLPEL